MVAEAPGSANSHGNYDRCHRKTKILRIVSRLNIGGASLHVALLSYMLDPQRFETVLVTGSITQREGDMSYLFNGKKTVRIKKIPELQREISIVKDSIAFLKIFRTILKEKPDIVDTHMAKAGALARICVGIHNLFCKKQIKTVHTYHGNVLEGYFGELKSRLFTEIERSLSKLTDVVIAISQTQFWELCHKYQIAEPNRIYTINLGMDLAPFLRSSHTKGLFRKANRIDGSAILIGIVGRLVPIKNHYMFLDAAKLFLKRYDRRSVKFAIIGDGELKSELEAYAREIGISDDVIFYGWEKDVYKVYADLDIVALTSKNEGTPVSIIEAMACSVPVITTGVGGIKDLLGKYTTPVGNANGFKICERGIVCPKDNPVPFANGLQYMIMNGYLTDQSRIANARNYVVQNYSDARLIENMEMIYTRLRFQ